MSDDEYFFPQGSLGASQEGDDLDRRAFSSVLVGIDEPSLSCGGTPIEAHRVLWYSPNEGGGRPIIARVSRDSAGWRSTTTHPKSSVDFREPVRTGNPLSDAEGQRLAAAIDKSGFWSAPNFMPVPSRTMTFDGATWIIEGRKGTAYHVARRMDLNDKFRAFIAELLKVADAPPAADLQ